MIVSYMVFIGVDPRDDISLHDLHVVHIKEYFDKCLNINLEFDMSSEDNFKKALSILKGKSPG